MPKKALRHAMLARRKSLTADEVHAASLRVQQAFVASPEFARAEVIALYSPIHGEVDTGEVMRTALAAGKKVLFPAVCGEDLRFYRVAGQGELRKGAFGIHEPCSAQQAIHPDAADIIVLPGVAFDLFGRRIGYGKGFYDRAVHHLEGQGRLVGFCHDFQLVAEIAGEPHDVAIDLIFTDQRIVRPGGYYRSGEVQGN